MRWLLIKVIVFFELNSTITYDYGGCKTNSLKAYGNDCGKDTSYMQGDDIITKLNEDGSKKWEKDAKNKNGGYPILMWQLDIKK